MTGYHPGPVTPAAADGPSFVSILSQPSLTREKGERSSTNNLLWIIDYFSKQSTYVRVLHNRIWSLAVINSYLNIELTISQEYFKTLLLTKMRGRIEPMTSNRGQCVA